jgi:hypothetical protein
MIRSVLINLLLIITCALNAQELPKNILGKVFRTAFVQPSELYGVFDSTESYFVSHFDSVVQSPFDLNCLLAGGKIWHRGIQTHFKGYITVDTTVAIQLPTDSLEASETDTFWALVSPEMKIPGTTLCKCEGEIILSENDTTQYIGNFQGTFTLYFYYREKSGFVKALPADKGYGLEPGMYMNGFWRSKVTKDFISIPFAIASNPIKAREDNQSELPDLRFREDGSMSFSNIAIFPEHCLKPQPGWFQ